jgi:hypothetical protein
MTDSCARSSSCALVKAGCSPPGDSGRALVNLVEDFVHQGEYQLPVGLRYGLGEVPMCRVIGEVSHLLRVPVVMPLSLAVASMTDLANSTAPRYAFTAMHV